MNRLGKYAHTNAKVRAKRSTLLTPSMYHNLADTASLHDVLTFLSKTRFKSFVDNYFNASMEELESALTHQRVHEIQMIAATASGSVKKWIDVYLQRFEIERLKIILRCWFRNHRDESEEGVSPSAYHSYLYTLPVDAMMEAEHLSFWLSWLGDTPFYSVFQNNLEHNRHPTLFEIELSLDRDYVQRLLSLYDSQSRDDAKVCRRITGLEIDINNLNWLVRYKQYYDLELGEILPMLLPGGYLLSTIEFMAFTEKGKALGHLKDKLNRVISRELLSGITGKSVELSQNLHLLEDLLYRILYNEAQKALAGFPFSIGTVYGFLILLQIEYRNLLMLFQAKNYKLPSETILSALVYS